MGGRFEQGVILADRFEIERLVARGGMGEIYRALDRRDGQAVALKVIRVDVEDPGSVERFQREVELLAKLSEPRIVRYVSHGKTAEGEPYLAMQWLEGEDLRAALRRGRLSLPDSLRVVEGTAEALAALHCLGIVHRDLKPGNLFLRGGSIADLVLLDFGLARRTEPSRRLTASGALLGTPQYMAPEQASSSQEIQPATDIFSLGCIFYECLTERPPFDAAHVVGVLARILFEEPELAQRLRPSIPREWSELLDRMMSKDPARRPMDAAALLREIAALPPGGDEKEPAVRSVRLHPKQMGGEQTLVCVIIALFPQADPAASGPETSEAHRNRDRLRVARRALARFGFGVEWLADGSLIASASPSGAATDQARVAAKAALCLREFFPEARIAVATGRAVLGQTTRVGEAIDRAVKLLEREPEERRAPSESMEGIWLDSVTAGLLGNRFQVVSQSSGSLLLSERLDVDEGRLLLGIPTPCVGRDLELTQLEGLVSRTVEDKIAQAALILGAAGTGKSRLRHEFLRRLRNDHPEIEVLVGYGDPLTAGSPYVILRDALLRHIGFHVGDEQEKARGALVERLCSHVAPKDQKRVREFLGELCGIRFPIEDSPPLQAAKSDPQAMSEQITLAFLDWIAAECSRHPVVLVLEDVQWGDALTVKLLASALRDREDQQFFVLALGRPEVKEIVRGLLTERGQEISLRLLSRKASEQLIKRVLGESIGQETIARIAELAGGNALFLEELIRAAAEGKAGDIPETVLAMLQARIARLPTEARRVLRAASILGETFWLGAIQRICEGWGASGSAGRLAPLVEAEIIERHRESRFSEETEYKFRHALVRDAAYGLLSEAELLFGHGAACEYLEQKGEADGMVLAEHAYRAGDLQRAFVFYTRAAEQSLARNDIQEVMERARRGIECGAAGETLGLLRAFQFFAKHGLGEWSASVEAGLDALSLLPQGGVWWCRVAEKMFHVLPTVGQSGHFQELVTTIRQLEPYPDARTDYVCAMSYLLYMYSTLDTGDEFQHLRERVQEHGATILERDARARSAFMLACATRSWFREPAPYRALKLAEESVSAAVQTGVLRNAILPKLMLGVCRAALGDWAEGERSLRSGIDIAKQSRHTGFAIGLGGYLGFAISIQLEPTRAGEVEQLATTLRDANIQRSLTAVAHAVLAEVHLSRGHLEQAEADVRKAREMFVLTPAYELAALAILLEILRRQGRMAEAADLAREGLSLLTKLGGSGWSEVRFRVAVAEVFHAAGELEAAHDALHEALRQIDLRVTDLPDEAFKERYLTGRPENVRAFELAREWLGATQGAISP